ncbi:PREDICTED: uncharacterized protein LOC106788308 [Polistes canadensis]|uniref:uncharacterized protein LOC106788308 n=1 Tax=Polistes canadensis TaxID=91411 RepID=UPI000718C745|nr:PREDICTED: uncharacterized protein LOC106788308 [Polistes canadensis]
MNPPHSPHSAWLDLSQNQMEHTTLEDIYNSHQSTSMEFSTEESLDDSEYPELGQKKMMTKVTPPDPFVSHYKSVREHTISYAKNKEKRSIEEEYRHRMDMEKEFLDFKQRLKITERLFMKRIQSHTVKDVNKASLSQSNRNKSNEMDIPLRKNRFCDAMFKKASRVKKMIEYKHKLLISCKDDDHFNVEPFLELYSIINFFEMSGMRQLLKYIPEDTVQNCPDVTQKLDELKISDVQDKNACISPYRNSVADLNDLNVSLNSKLSLTDENNVDIKPNINHLCDVKYSTNFREYCNNLVTLSLNESLDKFLSEIRRLQSKLYGRDKNKGKYKRRYYSGLKEVQKHVILKKVRFVVIAPDIEKIMSAGGLNEEVDKLLEMCRKNKTVYCFGLRRRKLGYYAHGNGFVSCIGISNYANAEKLFWNVLIEVVEARNAFEKLHGKSKEMVDVSKLTEENGLLMDNIEVVLKSLTSIN